MTLAKGEKTRRPKKEPVREVIADEVVPLGEMGKRIAELAGRYVRET